MHFTTRKTETTFTIDDDRFFLKPAIAAGKMLDLMGLKDAFKISKDGFDPDELRTAVRDMLGIPMQAKSVELFMDRFDSDDNPVDITTLMAVIDFVINEALGKAPEESEASAEPTS